MAESEDMIVPLLRETRVEIASLRSRMDERFDEIEKTQKTFKQALSADGLMTRLLTGEFEERFESVEKYGKRIEKLDQQIRAFEGRP